MSSMLSFAPAAGAERLFRNERTAGGGARMRRALLLRSLAALRLQADAGPRLVRRSREGPS